MKKLFLLTTLMLFTLSLMSQNARVGYLQYTHQANNSKTLEVVADYNPSTEEVYLRVINNLGVPLEVCASYRGQVAGTGGTSNAFFSNDIGTGYMMQPPAATHNLHQGFNVPGNYYNYISNFQAEISFYNNSIFSSGPVWLNFSYKK